MTVSTAMSVIWDSRGRAFELEGMCYYIENVRTVYGKDLQLTLDKPLEGKTSRLLTVNEDNAIDIAVAIVDY